MNLPARIGTTPNRIWDHDWNLVGSIPDIALCESAGEVLLELSHPVAQFIVDSPEKMKHLTVDSAQGRWVGRLHEFTVCNKMVRCQFESFDDEHRGWTHVQCPNCKEVLYTGIWIPGSDVRELTNVHKLVCESEER